MSAFDLGKSVGVVVGVLVGIIVCIVVFKLANKDHAVSTKYDERQKEVRGKAYTYAFWTTIVSCAALFLLDVSGVNLDILGSVKYFIPVFVGVLVQVTYSIWNDGYMGINNNSQRYLVIFVAIALFNASIAIRSINEKGVFENGVMSADMVNVLCAALLVIVCIEIGIKALMSKREEEE
ncbi:MAG: hypothetical protein K6D02_03745 [Lachnospiraceae bacterium]|nr:hypothetical protein [Lachnospiraceae bacterium]